MSLKKHVPPKKRYNQKKEKLMTSKITLVLSLYLLFFSFDSHASVIITEVNYGIDLGGQLGTFEINLDETEGSNTTDIIFSLEFNEEVSLRIKTKGDSLTRTNIVSNSSTVHRLEAGNIINENSPFNDPSCAKILWSDDRTSNWLTNPTPAFIGARFLDDYADEYHYAWILFGIDELETSATIFRYAYETTPERQITIKPIPIPGTFWLFSSSCFFLFSMCGRRLEEHDRS